MRYDLGLDREDFDKANRIVKAVLLRSGRAEVYAPNLLTSDANQLNPIDQTYLVDNPESLGVCFKETNSNTFDIWVTPAFRTNSDWYRTTVLHELCHGYLGLYVHNHRWRRFFGRVLYHYQAIVQPIGMETLLPNAIRRDTEQGRDESWPKYLTRIEMEQTAIEKIAVDELDEVFDMYNRLTRRDERAKGVALP